MTSKYKLFVLFSLLVIAFASGCIETRDEIDERFATATEEYHMGWILHNINDSTSTDLSYSLDDVAMYNYTFNYPDYEPERFSIVFLWNPPVHKNGSSLKAEFRYQMSVPLNRTYFLKGVNPIPEYYSTNWSLSNYMYINYESSTNIDYKELYRDITPIPGEREHIYWGSASFRPTGIKVSNNFLTLIDHLVKGRNDNSYLFRDTWGFYSSAIPRYEIYLNGNKVYEGELIDYWDYWDYSVLNYSISSDGTYLVKITIPTSYSVWNVVKIDAQFTKPSSDVQPPLMNGIEAKPYFNYNEVYEIRINITDDVGIDDVNTYYKDATNWISLPITSVSGIYNTSINITQSILSLDFMLSAVDTSGNQVNYTIHSLALPAKNVSIDMETDTALKGGILRVEGIVEDDEGSGIGGLRLEFFLNDTYVDRGMSEIESNKGSFQKDIKNLSCDVTGLKNISVFFAGTGVYPPNRANASIEIVPLDCSVNDIVPVNDYTLINATGAGALLTINRTDLNWTYISTMNRKTFNFIPHNYGNYTISLNTSCGENVTKSLFSDITEPPYIYDITHIPFYPMEGDDISVYTDTYSQDGYQFVDGNVSNSTYSTTCDFSRYYGCNLIDYSTKEPYNSSYGIWLGNVSNLNAGKYNISINLKDIINQKANITEELLVYQPLNITFNITDRKGNPQARTISIRFGPYQTSTLYDYHSILGVKRLRIPRVSLFNKRSHVSLDNYLTYYNGIFVTFVRTKINESMNVISEYYEKDTFVDGKILHSIYAYEPSWDYDSSVLECYYYHSDTARLNVSHPELTTLYTCSDWDFSSQECKSEWKEASITGKYAYSIWITGTGGKDEAFAFGEPQFCGDGYCSSSEDCSSCPGDCGQCETTTTTTIITDDNVTTTTTTTSTTATTTTTTTTETTTTTTISTTTTTMVEMKGTPISLILISVGIAGVVGTIIFIVKFVGIEEIMKTLKIGSLIERVSKVPEALSSTTNFILKYPEKYVGKKVSVTGDLKLAKKGDLGELWYVLEDKSGKISVRTNKTLYTGRGKLIGRVIKKDKNIFIQLESFKVHSKK